MSNGIVSIPAPAPVSALLAVLLAAVLGSLSGCGRESARPPATQARINAPQNLPPTVRYRMDPLRNRMWILTPDGVFVYDVRTPKTIVEVALPSWQSVDHAYSCLPDLALGPRGEAVVTSNIVPTLWKIDPDSLAVSVHELALDADKDKDVGFSGLAYSVQHGAFFAVSGMHGSLWRIDPLLSKGQKISLPAPVREACAITMPPRGAQYAGHQRTELCIHAEQGGWTINLKPDGLAAHVATAACEEPLTRLALD